VTGVAQSKPFDVKLAAVKQLISESLREDIKKNAPTGGGAIWGQALVDALTTFCTPPDTLTDFDNTPSYRVLHPAKYLQQDIGMYVFADDLGDQDVCSADADRIKLIDVTFSNALKECAQHCARAILDVGARVCNGFTIESPNRCSLYTKCHRGTASGKGKAISTAASYRIRTEYGPFMYSGEPRKTCETEYTPLPMWEGGVSTYNLPGPHVVQKSTSRNPVEDCMELCAAHHTQDPAKGCGGFSVGDNGACRLHGPCKTTSSAVVTRPLFHCHSGSATTSPKNQRITPVPTGSDQTNDAAWGAAADSFCAVTYGEGYRSATVNDAKTHGYFCGDGYRLEDRRWGTDWGYCNLPHPQICTSTDASAGWSKANNFMHNPSYAYTVCYDASRTTRYYQLPNSVSVYSRVPKLNMACSAKPMLKSSTADTWRKEGLLRYCAEQCNAQSLGTATDGLIAQNSGCVGFTVSTAGHCELHAECDAASLHHVRPEMNIIRVSYSMNLK